MDSGNSGSLQSSSGGDEEYDSRTESISAFLNSSSHVASMSNPQQPLSLPSHHHSNNNPLSMFDPLSNYLDTFSRSPPPPNVNSLLNHDIVWPRGLRSEPNCTEIGGLMGSSSSQPNSGFHGRSPYLHQASSSMPLTLGPETGVRAASSSAQLDQPNLAARNSKKRSRASRRAPTTVLTTDTSNFRAMVQEFTGIPAPPFSASAFPRTRLDLFNTAGPPPSSLLRPFAQKVQPRSFVSSSSFSASSGGATTTTTTTIVSTSNTSNSASASNYQLPSQNLINMQNPLLNFQSLLQSQPPQKYPSANIPIFGEKTQGSLKGVLGEFSLSHDHGNPNLTTLPSLVTSDGMSLRSENNPPSWGDRVRSDDAEQGQLRSFHGNYGNSQRVNGCKINFSASPSDLHAEKGSENVSSRGEGMVDSWICSSE